MRAFAAGRNPDLDINDASNLCWSTMQGLLELYPKIVRIGDVRGPPPAGLEELVARFTTLIIDGFRAPAERAVTK